MTIETSAAIALLMYLLVGLVVLIAWAMKPEPPKEDTTELDMQQFINQQKQQAMLLMLQQQNMLAQAQNNQMIKDIQRFGHVLPTTNQALLAHNPKHMDVPHLGPTIQLNQPETEYEHV